MQASLKTVASPKTLPLVEELRELWKFRDLISQLVTRELKVRYKNSVLGFFWSIVPPLLQVLVYSFAMRDVLKVDTKNYSAYLLCALIPWTFITTATLDSSQSLLINFGIIKKTYMPREVIPLAIVISNFIHFLMGWAVYFVAFLIVLPFFHDSKGHPLGIHMDGMRLLTNLWMFPLITLITTLFVTGLCLWASALNVFYDDVKFILQTLFNLMLFLMPILYSADNIYYRVPHWVFKLYMLNPIPAVIDAYRKTILEPAPTTTPNHLPFVYVHWDTFVGSAIVALLFALSGYWYFNYRKWQFVERP
jgi:lipopolysaccharide transport system permease protein